MPDVAAGLIQLPRDDRSLIFPKKMDGVKLLLAPSRSRRSICLGGLPQDDAIRRHPASMTRKADCYDNAPMESFFHTLKTEFIHHLHNTPKSPT
jgi:transposase InsO family protein